VNCTQCGTVGDLKAAVCRQEDEFHENLIYGGLFRKRSVSLEDTAVSSTASDPDMAVFQQQRAAAVAGGVGPEDVEEEDDDEDDVSEARSAPPVVQHGDGELSDDDVEGMEQDQQVAPQVDTSLLALFVER
jgi:hypothetical protein